MPATITYNTASNTPAYIFRATGGGTVFSANLAGNAAFDYFVDAPTVGDALYFSGNGILARMSNLDLTVGTAMAGTGITLVWEYRGKDGNWHLLHNFTDGTAGFTVTGKLKFPTQEGANVGNVNGIAAYHWIRCRLAAFTTFTEGGANITNTPKISDGMVTVSGTTDASPATWTELYNWLVTNAPETEPTKIGNSCFWFKNMQLTINSRLTSTNENIILGNICGYSGYLLYYLTMGQTSGTNGYVNPSHLFFSVYSGGASFSFSANANLYGMSINKHEFNYRDTGTSIGTQVIGTSSSGNYKYVSSNVANGYFADATLKNVFYTGQLILSGVPTNLPTGINIVASTSAPLLYYANNCDLSDVTYEAPSESVGYLNQLSRSYIFNLINPSPKLYDQVSVPVGVSRGGVTAGYSNISTCVFYDSATTTFTNYTTQANDATAGDVPLGTNVGDILYLRNSSVSNGINTPVFKFTVPSQTNNYTYAIEYYSGTSWKAVDKLWDRTANFTSSDKELYFAYYSTWSSTTINGTAGLWLRIRITATGTGTPKISRIQNRLETGVSEWNLYEKYTTNLKVIDNNNNAISGAVITIKDSTGAAISGSPFTTAADGTITAQDILRRRYYFDPINAYTNYAQVAYDDKNPYTISVSKANYQTKTVLLTIDSKRTPTQPFIVPLEKSLPFISPQGGSVILNLDKTNSQNKYKWSS